MAYVTAPDGTQGEVPDDQLQQAQAAGYKTRAPAPDEVLRKQARDQPGRAAIEGAVRGATLGLGDPLLFALGAKPAEVLARKRENPVAAGFGEFGGVAATTLATGGGASALAGGGLKGAAFEGGLYGMGSMVSESALENRELTTDRLATGLISGTLSAGTAQLGLTALGKGVSLGMSKFGGQGLKSALNEAAFSLEERALMEGNKNLVKKLESQGGSLRDVVEYAKKEGVPVAFNEETAAKARDVLERTGDMTTMLMRRLDKAKPLTNMVDRASLANSVEQKLAKRFKGDIAAENTVQDFIDSEIAPLVDRSDLKYTELYKLQSRLRERVRPMADDNIKKDVYNAGRKILRDTIFEDAKALNPGVQAELQGLQSSYAKGAFLNQAIEGRMASIKAIGGVPGIGVMDVIRGGGFGGSVGGTIGGPVGASLGAVAGAYANKAMRERGGAVVASALRGIADSQVTSGVSKGLMGHLSNVLSLAPEVLGAYRFPLAQAAAQGADAMMQTHIALASGPHGQDYLTRAALPVESPEEVVAAGERLAVLDSLESSAQAYGVELSSAADGLFGSARGRKGSVGSVLNEKSYRKFTEQMHNLLRNPETAFELIPHNIRGGAPAVSGEAVAKVLKAFQYLDSKAPKNPYEGMPPSIAPHWQPSAADLDRFNRYKEAVENPAQVLKNLAQGYQSPEQIEALKAVYPAMYADLQQKISERMMMLKKPLDYRQKAALTMFLGPGALGMSPAQVQVLQQAQGLAQGKDSGQGKPMKGPDGRQDVNEKQIQTEAQKLEAR